MMKRYAPLLLCLCLFTPRLSWAETVIQNLQVRGNQRIETQVILGTIESRVGMPFSEERTRRDIEKIYRLGAFDRIQVERTHLPEGIRLTYVVEEKTRIGKITFAGNKKVKDEKLFELIEVKPFKPLDAAQLQSSVRKIQEHYAEEGYYLAEVKPEFKKISGTSDQELVLNINERSPVRIQRVNFIGNKVFSDRELRKKIQTKAKGPWSWLTSKGKYQEEMLKRDSALLAYHYQNNGYLKVKIDLPKIYLSRDRQWVTITFHVVEGTKYKIGNVGIEGDILTTKEELISKFKAKSGQTYARKDVEEDLRLLAQLYGDQGYAFANVNPVIQPHDEEKTADILYLAQKGPKVMIEQINISGNTITRDKVIRREMLVKENTLYNETRLRQSRERIMALGYFEEVNFATPRGSRDDRIHINVSVKEKPTGTFSIGAGFSSVENFIFTASIAKQNFFGYGVSGQFSLELSSKRQLFVLSFEDPYFLDSNWIFGLSGFRTVNSYTDFDRRSFGGNLSLGHRIFDSSTFRMGYEIEDVNVGDFQTTVPAKFTQNISGLTSASNLSLTRDTRDNRLFPSHGMYQSVSTEFAGLGGDNQFFRVIENFRYYQPLWKSIVGKFNANIGQISSLNTLPVPLFERFFMGGVNSLRGYFLRSIGPAVQIPNSPQGGDNRFVFGGNKMFQMNFELELPIYDPAGFRFVTFVDTGNSFSEEQNFSVTDLRSDYGFGFRWHSPLGPLRFEWGIPISKKADEDSVVFNFTIGSFF